MCGWSVSTARVHSDQLPLVAPGIFRIDWAVSLGDESRSPRAGDSVKHGEVFESTEKNTWLSGRIAMPGVGFVRLGRAQTRDDPAITARAVVRS